MAFIVGPCFVDAERFQDSAAPQLSSSLLKLYVEIREIDPLSVIVPISKIRKPYLPIGLNICNTLYRADVPSKKWFRIVFREDQPSTKEQPEGGREPE